VASLRSLPAERSYIVPLNPRKRGTPVKFWLQKGPLAAVIVLVVVLAQAYSLDAAATLVNFDEFAVVRDGTTIFDDSFDRNTTLNGGSGTPGVPSGTTFSDGTPATYFDQGSIPLTTPNNGQAQVNTANGVLIAQPPPLNLIQQVNLGLQTGMNPAGPHTLTPANTFSAVGLFDLAVPSVLLGRYYFYLGNNTATPGREVRIQIRQTDTGPVLLFIWLNFAAGQNTIIDQVALTPAELADPQLELEFSHDSANSDVLTASYAFGSGNTLATFNGTLTALGSTDSSTDIFTPTLNWAQPGFEAFDPVPEPSSLAILAAGFFGLAAFAQRGNRRPRPPKLPAAFRLNERTPGDLNIVTVSGGRISRQVFGGDGNDALPGCFGAVCDCRQDFFVRQPRILVEQFHLCHVVGEKIEDQRDPNPGPLYAWLAPANTRVGGNSLKKRVHALASDMFAGGSPQLDGSI
jgi:hypothetical protein